MTPELSKQLEIIMNAYGPLVGHIANDGEVELSDAINAANTIDSLCRYIRHQAEIIEKKDRVVSILKSAYTHDFSDDDWGYLETIDQILAIKPAESLERSESKETLE